MSGDFSVTFWTPSDVASLSIANKLSFQSTMPCLIISVHFCSCLILWLKPCSTKTRTRGFLMEAYIRVRLTHFKDRLYGHYKEHARYFGELGRTMDEDPELSYKEYTDLKAQLLFGEAPRGRMQTTCRA